MQVQGPGNYQTYEAISNKLTAIQVPVIPVTPNYAIRKLNEIFGIFLSHSF